MPVNPRLLSSKPLYIPTASLTKVTHLGCSKKSPFHNQGNIFSLSFSWASCETVWSPLWRPTSHLKNLWARQYSSENLSYFFARFGCWFIYWKFSSNCETLGSFWRETLTQWMTQFRSSWQLLILVGEVKFLWTVASYHIKLMFHELGWKCCLADILCPHWKGDLG